MLIGMGQKKTVEKTADNADIFSVTAQEFEAKLLPESQKRPVLIDFWAPWCGPCKQLMPVIEQAVNEQKGAVALAKVNIDEEPELAQAFRVQSVPTVIAFFMGQPVAAFQGVRPKSEIDSLIHQLVQMQKSQMPDALDIPAVLEAAKQAMADKDFATAHNLYSEVIANDNQNAAAISGLLRIFIAEKDFETAKQMIAMLPDTLLKDAGIVSAMTALELAQAAPSENWQSLDTSNDPEGLYRLAEACFAADEKNRAVEALVSIISKNRAWEDDKARKQLLKYFEAWGPADPASMAGRRKLSSLLFS